MPWWRSNIMELAWICAQQVAVLFLLIGAGALAILMGTVLTALM